MYLDDYKRWLAADLEDPDLKPELLKIADEDEAIKRLLPQKDARPTKPHLY